MEITRGDNKTFKFQRKSKDGSVITTIPTEIYFTVKKDYSYTDFLIQKRLSNGGITFNTEDNFYRFEFTPEDTNELSFGEYVYDIEKTENGKVLTISKGKLIITEESTHSTNKE